MKDKAESLKGSTLDNRGWQQGRARQIRGEGRVGVCGLSTHKKCCNSVVRKSCCTFVWISLAFSCFCGRQSFLASVTFSTLLSLSTSPHPFMLNPLYNFYACHILLCSWTCVSVCVSVCLKNRRANSSMGLACPPPLSPSQSTTHSHLRQFLPLVCQSFTVWLANLLWKLICT